MQRVYKVTMETLRDKKDPHNIKTSSAFAVDGWALEYTTGKQVYPDLAGSFLYAFETVSDAVAWLDGSLGKHSILSNDAVLRVYEGLADVVDAADTFYTMDSVERFWVEQWWLFGEAYPHVLRCPPGTLWCASINLREVVFTDQRVLKVPVPKPAYH